GDRLGRSGPGRVPIALSIDLMKGNHMAIGPGQYDDLCTRVREESQAQAVVLIVLGGNKGNGFSMQAQMWDGSPRTAMGVAAIAAMKAWDPDKDPEPDGWVRHVPSFRRRPGGDKSKEYVRH